MHRFLVAFALAAAAAAATGGTANPVLSARPAAAATILKPGINRLGSGALAYRPAALGPGPHPLVVLLHGHGGGADRLVAELKAEADKRGLILLAPRSLDRTWDLIVDAARFRGGRPKAGERLKFGGDVPRVDAALVKLFTKAAVDPRRIVLAGFSDGASYALSLGMANPELFAGVLALSPGLMVAPSDPDATQRLFISHGRSDRVIPVQVSRDGLARALAKAGMTVRFRQFNGGHEIDRKALGEGLDFTLGTGDR